MFTRRRLAAIGSMVIGQSYVGLSDISVAISSYLFPILHPGVHYATCSQIQHDLPIPGGHPEGWTVSLLPPPEAQQYNPKSLLASQKYEGGRVVEGLSSGRRGPLWPSVCGIVYLSDTNIWHIDNITN